LRRQDFRAVEGECPVFGMNIADVGHARSILLVGCNPREEAPIVGHRVRQAWRKGAKVAAINSVDWDFHFDTAPNHVVPPQRMVAELAAVASAAAEAANADIPAGLAAVVDAAEVTDAHRSLAAQLAEHTPSLVMLGATALEHIDAALLQSLARFLAASTGAACNLLTPGCNSVGAATYGAMPGTGMHAGEMLSAPLQTYLLWDVDPGCDLDNPAAAQAALAGADHVIAVTSFASEALREVASVILPLSPLAESEGSILNFDGDETLFAAAAKPRGESRPGWKILRRLGDGLGLSGFDQVRLEQVREAMQPVESAGAATAFEVPAYAGALFRTGSVPMYAVDALCRRSPALQQTTHADKQFVGLNPADAARFGLVDGGKARVRQGDAYTELEVRLTERVPAGAALVHSGLEAVRSLGASCAPIIVEVA
jgi:NADH-quinone oxidoreductase subunit G